MIICYLADATTIHTQRWASHFAALGHTVHVISFNQVVIPGVSVHPLPSRGRRKSQGGNWQLLLSLPAVKTLLQRIKPDLLHSHYLTSYGLLGALSGFKPLVGTAWGSDILVTPSKSSVYRLLLRFTLSRCDIVTSDSVFMGGEALKYGLPRAKLRIVPLGVNATDFNQIGRAWPENPPFTMLSMRFLDANANTSHLLRALPLVLAAFPETSLIITNQGPEMEKLKCLAASLKLEKQVDFRGTVAHRQVPLYLKQADLYFSLLNTDATSVTLLEAMACGAFPLATHIPANEEWIIDGQNGYLVRLTTPESLAEKIIAALKQPELRFEAARANRRLISQKANWDLNMQTVLEIYRQLV